MPSNFYARYVPAVEIQNIEIDDGGDINPRPAKRKKESKVAEFVKPSIEPNGIPSGTEIPGISGSLNGIAKEQKRSKKKQLNAPEIDDSINGKDFNHETGDKHVSIRTKFKQAGEKSEEALKNSNQSIITDDEDTLEIIQPVGLQPLPQPRRVREEPRAKISALPDWMTRPVHANEHLPFTDLGLSTNLTENLSRAGFKTAFPIQSTLIPMLNKPSIQHQSDICVSAPTGSGKTLAYTLPIIEALNGRPVVRLRAMIIVPTRELVNQVKDVFRLTKSSLKVGTAVGSSSLKEERSKLIELDQIYDPEAHKRIYNRRRISGKERETYDSSSEDDTDDDFPMQDYIIQRSSKIDVLICTPGRLVEHLRITKGFSLEHIQWLVIDEADRLLDQSFQQWIDLVMPQLQRTPSQVQSTRFRWSNHVLMPHQIVRKVVLSATMTRDYSKLLALELKDPVLVVAETTGNENIDSQLIEEDETEPILTSIPQQLLEVAVAVKDAAEKPLYLIQLMETELTTRVIAKTVKNSAQFKSLEPGSRSKSSSDTSLSSDSEDDGSDSSSYSSSSLAEASSDDTSSSGESPNEGTERDAAKSTSTYGTLIFVNTNENALRLCRLLAILRPSWSNRILPLTKSVGSSSGRKALSAFRQRKADILVATDLASRGLDLKNLAQVVNYDMPKSLTTYIHRIGRTARAGCAGIASTMVSHHEARWFWNEIGQSIDVERTRKIGRKEIHINPSDKEVYEAALVALGQEAKG